jgi:hypothetical protein
LAVIWFEKKFEPTLPGFFGSNKMKRIISVALFAMLVITSVTPLFGQKGRVKTFNAPIGDEFARFENIEALTNGSGVLVRWQMAEEKGNAGFTIYRQGTKGLEQVNDSLKIGSFGKYGNQSAYGEVYEIFDEKGTIGTDYVVEAWKIGSDRRVFSQTVNAKFKADIEVNIAKSNGSLSKSNLGLTKELTVAQEESLLPPDLPTHRLVVAQPGAKIGVRKDGIYRVTRAELQNVGFNVNSNSANWRLFMEGNEQAIIVGAGDQYIEFYGRGLETTESDTRMYYLIADAVPGKRMQTRVLRNIGGNVLTQNYRVSAEKKERTTYIYNILNSGAENFWGRPVSTTPTTVPLPVTGIDFSSTATVTLTLRVQGFSQTAHQTRVVLNGTELGIMSGQQQLNYSTTYTIPVNLLVEGNNSLELTSTVSGDFVLFDTATVSYARKYVADQNKVAFYTPGLRKVDLGNFSTANVRLFDTTFDGNPTLVLGAPVVQSGATFTMKMPSARSGIFYGVEDSALLQSPTVTANNPSTLSTAANAGHLIIISHGAPDFMAAAETWANYRRNQGFAVKVVDVADVYDEFNYGVLSANAINSFLNYAKNNWQTQPNYVLLLGDGSYDSRNYEGTGYWNMVPPKLAETVFSEVPSDEALADFNGDGLAELAIGRIPARTASVITTAFNKTTAFENAPMQSLNRGAVFAYDLPIGFDFQAMCQLLRDELPPNIPAPMIGRGDPNAHDTLINEINLNSGRYIVNWCGHGTTGLWGDSNFFTTAHVPQLTNSNPTLFTMLTCLNGYFITTTGDSLSEALLKSPTGGAAATWASTGLTTPDVQMIMGLRFFEQTNVGSIKRMGDLVRDAKTQIPFGADVRLSWALLGDPMMQVRP